MTNMEQWFIIWYLSFKIVLSFLLCLVSKLNGMVWTMMIAAETGEAVLVVEPLRHLSLPTINVFDRANIGTDATLHAFVCCDVETLVGDEYVLEETAYYFCHEPRQYAFDKTEYLFFAIENLLTYHLQLLCRSFLFPYLFLLWINVHERQAYIRFWHDEGVSGRYSANT